MNLAHKHEPPQAEVVQFPKQERITMANKKEGYTRTPNYLVDDDYVAEMSGNALKCYVVINRFTSGFSRQNWAMTSGFLQEKTGIKKDKTLTDAVRQLEQFGLLLVERSTGETNKFTVKAPLKMDTAILVTTPEKRGGTTPEKGGTKKESIQKENSKENFKESESANSPESILQIWQPNTKDLNAWLRRSGEMALTENLIEQVLLEFNPYYESKYRMGLLSENQMYSNFVKWVKRGVNFNSSKSAPKPNSRNVNDVWGEPKQYAPASDIDTGDYL